MGTLQLVGLTYIGISTIMVGVYARKRRDDRATWIAGLVMLVNVLVASWIALTI